MSEAGVDGNHYGLWEDSWVDCEDRSQGLRIV